MRIVALALATALCGCGAVSDLNPFAPKDTKLLGDRETVFSSNTAMPSADAMKPASVGPARANADWPQPGGNAQNAPGHVAFAGGGTRAWRANVGGTNFTGGLRGSLRIASRPVMSGDRVYVYAPDGTVTALSAGSGGRVWRANLRPEGERDSVNGGGIAVDGGRVFAATGYGEVVALDASNGEVIWTKPVDTPLRGAPTASAGKVFVVSQQNEVFAINQSDGSEAFTYAGIPEQAGLLAASSPAVSGDTVVIPYTSGEVMAFSISKGEAKWQTFVTRPQRTLAITGLPDVSGSPVIVGNTVYATGVGGRTIAVDLNSGTEKWGVDVGSANTPAVSGDSLFLVDLVGQMVALSRSTGEVLWVRELPKPKKKKDGAYSGPVLAGGSLWAISNNGRLAQLDPSNGTILSDRDVGTAGFASPIVAGGQMIIVSGTGEVSALR